MFGTTFTRTALHADSQISAILALLTAVLAFTALLPSYSLSTAVVGAALAYVLVLRSLTRHLQVQPWAALLATVLILGAVLLGTVLVLGALAFGWLLANRGQQ